MKKESLLDRTTKIIARFLGSWWAVLFHTFWFITTASRRILRASVLGDEPQLRCKRSSKADVAKPFGEAESFLHNVKETPSVSSELNVEDLRAGGGFIVWLILRFDH